MRTFYYSIFLFFLCISNVNAMGSRSKYGPSVWLSNISEKRLQFVKIDYGSLRLLNRKFGMPPGQTASQIVTYSHFKDYLTPINITWKNNVGKSFTKQFYLNDRVKIENNADLDAIRYLEFRLTQDDVELFVVMEAEFQRKL